MAIDKPSPKYTRQLTHWRHFMLSIGLLIGVMAQAQTGTIQVGSGPLTDQYSPLYSCYTYNYSQQIYLASELTQGSGVAGDITAIRFYYDSGSNFDQSSWTTWTLYLANTSQSSFSGPDNWVDPNTLTLSYSGIVTPVEGAWMEMTLDTPFNWDGTSNVVVALYENAPNYDCTANWRAFDAGSNRSMLFFSDPIDPDPTAPPSANYGPSIYLAQVQFVGAMADCVPPQDLTVGSITSTGASFTWTDGDADSYDYEVRTSGAAGSGPLGLVTFANVTSGTPAIELSALEQNTEYAIYVRSMCDGDPSQWSYSTNFLTPCDATDIPYWEDFNTVIDQFLPDCISTETLEGNTWSGNMWPPMGMTGGTATISYDWMTGSAMDSWVFSRGINMVAGNSYRLKYKYSTGGDWSIENLSVYYTTGLSASDTVAMLADHPSFNSILTLTNSVDFIPATDGVYYIAFRGYSEPYQAQIFVDDISVTNTPTCDEASQLNALTTSDTSGLVTWVESITPPADGYDIYYSTDPTPPDADAVPNITGVMDTVAALADLPQDIMQYVWVRAHCTDTDQSFWTGPVTFTPGTFQIGSGPMTSYNLPIYSCYGYNYSQQIYLADEYAGGATILSVRFKVTEVPFSLDQWNVWTVYMGNTDQSGFTSGTDWVPFGQLEQVFTGTVYPIQGEWMEIVFDTPFAWDGTSNFVIAVDENIPNYSCTASWASFQAGGNRGMLTYSDNSNPDPMSPPAANYGPTATVPQIQLVGITPIPCNGLPEPGITLGPDSICAGVNFTLTVENPTTESGITRQWQVSTDGSTWTDAPAPSSYGGYTTSQTEATWYRCEVTCDDGGTTPSDPIYVAMNTYINCYCTSFQVQYGTAPICHFSYAGIDNSSNSSNSAPGYEDFTIDVAPGNVMIGLEQPYSIMVNVDQWSTTNVVAFFDWDQDGTFESSQFLGSTSNNMCATPLTGTILVPPGALPGLIRMRIISSFYQYPYDACGQYDTGQGEDYLLNVLTPVACSETPTPGMTTGPETICPSVNFTLTFENQVLESGLSYQWQTSLDGTTWTDATGISTQNLYTTSQLVAKWYRVEATCDAAGTGTSTPIQVAMAPPTECYCTSINFQYTVEPICSVTFADIDNTSNSSANGSPSLEDFTNMSTDLVRGYTYTLSVTGNTDGWGTSYVTAFFDWDGNGAYETLVNVGDYTQVMCDSVASVDVTVPANAFLGTSRVRIVQNEESPCSDPCGVFYYGQAEDYTLNVIIGEGIAENSALGELFVYPNPASTVLHISTKNATPVNIVVYDLLGHEVMSSGSVTELQITDLATGSYLLVATDVKGQQARARFMKQ